MKCEACNWQEMPNNVASLVNHVEHCAACINDETITVWRKGEFVAIKKPAKKLAKGDVLMEGIVFKNYEKLVRKVEVADVEVVLPENLEEQAILVSEEEIAKEK